MNPIPDNLGRVRDRIGAACRTAGRSASEVRLVAVCKTFPAAAVRAAAASGQTDFGENRFQEADLKMRDLEDLKLVWHFLGQIQSNKLHRIMRRFAMLQSIDRIEILDKAERVLAEWNEHRDGLLEINISGEPSKSGFEPEEFRALLAAGAFGKYRHVRLRGLMGIGPHLEDRVKIRRAFDRLRALYEE